MPLGRLLAADGPQVTELVRLQPVQQSRAGIFPRLGLASQFAQRSQRIMHRGTSSLASTRMASASARCLAAALASAGELPPCQGHRPTPT
jgi:hypothetical protein